MRKFDSSSIFRFFGLTLVLAMGSPGPLGAADFPIRNMALLGHLYHDQMGGVAGSGIWGWTDAQAGREYALYGQRNGTAFVDITDPRNPTYLGRLPTHTGNSVWRELKVYQDHAYVISDNNGPHGVQIFDLRNLRGVTEPQIFSATAHYSGNNLRNAHNLFINEETGFAYVVGSNLAAGGLVMLNVSNPTSLFQVGTFAADGYTHDLQVVVYRGPDASFFGREIAFNSNIDTLTIVDVTNKSNPNMLARLGYPDSRYAHQGWLTDDHRYFLLDDELDEGQLAPFTRTHVFDVSSLNNPVYIGFHESELRATDHNQYIHNGRVYQANYTAGLRVLDIVDPTTATLKEVAYLDTIPGSNGPGFQGAWSVYPFFESGSIIVGDTRNGLFVARLAFVHVDFNGDGAIDCQDIDALTTVIASGAFDVLYDLNNDGVVDLDDRDAWLKEAGETNLGILKTYQIGDANLDGVVDGQDFVIWNTNKFTASSAWCSGDFNADGSVDGSDFILWNQSKFTQAGSPEHHGSIVPEPTIPCVAVWGAAACLVLRRIRARVIICRS